jgi:hypothetical protein
MVFGQRAMVMGVEVLPVAAGAEIVLALVAGHVPVSISAIFETLGNLCVLLHSLFIQACHEKLLNTRTCSTGKVIVVDIAACNVVPVL